MDKYELRVSIDEIDSLISERRFREAAELADTIDWKKIKSTHVLCRISDLYKINRRYKDSRDLMEIAYARNPSGRKIIYSLCELELKLNNYIHALQLYNAFINVAPRDPDRFLLQYKLYKAQDVNVREQIAVLEEFQQREFRERWAYELATLYARAGEEQSCIRQCDEIIAWFGDGRFVIRALELKKTLAPLTPQQQERLEILRSGGTIAPSLPAQDADVPQQEAAPDAGPKRQEAAPSADTQPQKAASDADAKRPQEAVPNAEPQQQKAGPGSAVSGAPERDFSVETDAASAAQTPVSSETAPAFSASVPSDPETGPETEEDAPGDAGDLEPAATPEEYTDALLRDVRMEETIARGMREIGDYDSVLEQESSGQLAMVIEEEPVEESQIEGQLDLEQIMSEWEKIRRESEQKRLAEARRRVLEKSDAAKRQLYGDAAGSAAQEEAQDPAAAARTRSWKRQDVEKGLSAEEQ